MNYTPTKVGGFWEHEVVFRIVRLVCQIPNLQNFAILPRLVPSQLALIPALRY